MGCDGSKAAAMAPVKSLVVFEVLEGYVVDAEWRMGDWWTVGVLGMRRPCIKVKFGNQVKRSVPKRTFFVRRGCNVEFGVRMVFSLEESSDKESFDLTVCDQRNVQAALRGNPLIGKAEVWMDQDSAGTLVQKRVDLRRNDPLKPTGWLTIQYRVVRKEAVQDGLGVLGVQPMHDVANVLAGVLKTPDGVKRLLCTRPKHVAPVCGARLRNQLESIVTSFCGTVDSFSRETDDEILNCLAPLSRSFLTLIAGFIQSKKGEELDTIELALEWLRSFYQRCAGSDQALVGSAERLQRWLTSSHIDPTRLEPVDVALNNIDAVALWTPGVQPPPKSILGQGSYGWVFLARDRDTKQVCAVKQMIFRTGRPAEVVARRESEIGEVLRLSAHPCIVRLFSVNRHSETCASLIMEYCAGGDMQAAIHSCRDSDRYSLPPRAQQWVAQMFLGLEYLHLEVGMLVRDVKPQNVVLTKGGLCAKLIDFGVSRLDTTSDGTFSFHKSVPPGSALYVAPEVIRGAGYDYHADLYSLAVLVWVLYTGGLVSPSVAMPPCAQLDSMLCPAELVNLCENWQMLRACIDNPEENDARPLPSEDVRDIVLRLTDRSEDYQQFSHEDLRVHPFLQDMDLPPHANAAAIKQWLDSLR